LSGARISRIAANGLSHSIREWGEAGSTPVLMMHGFPDSSLVWDKVAPLIAAAGYHVIAPDMRGFGDTDAPPRVADYAIETGAAADMKAILAALRVPRAHLVGHDFGAVVGWLLAAEAPELFLSWSALSVGHPMAYLAAGAEQKRRSFYILVHQLRGVCEALYRRKDWALLRNHWEGVRDVEQTIALLSRPGRLTAGLNWYRANIPFGVMLGLAPPREAPPARLPTLGVWSDGERYLVESQMQGSGAFVGAPFGYARIDRASHWLQQDQPEALAALLLRHFRDHSPA
jgi:pimeloyl-ACP methyl ester carboxylesterase